MVKKHNIDNLFKTKLGEREFLFDESVWNKAEMLIEKEERRKKRFGYLIFSSLLVIPAIVLIFIYSSTQETKKYTEKQTIENKEVIPSLKNELNTTNQLVSTYENTNEIPNDNSSITHETDDNQIITQKKHKKNNNTGNTDYDIKPVKSTIQKTKKREKTVSKTENFINSDIALNTNTIFNPPSDSVANYVTIDKMNSKNYDPQCFLSKQNISTQNFEKNKKSWLTHSSLGVIIGINTSKALKNTKGKNPDLALGTILGIRYSARVTNEFSFDVNVLYQSRGGLNSVARSGSDIITMTTTKSLNYIDIPFYFNYRSDRHNVIMGYQHSQLVGSIDEVTILKKEANELVQQSTKTKWQNSGAFSSIDGALILGYEYVWTDLFNIGIRGNYGLFDVTDNISFANTIKDRNVQIRFLIDYKFLNY